MAPSGNGRGGGAGGAAAGGVGAAGGAGAGAAGAGAGFGVVGAGAGFCVAGACAAFTGPAISAMPMATMTRLDLMVDRFLMRFQDCARSQVSTFQLTRIGSA